MRNLTCLVALIAAACLASPAWGLGITNGDFSSGLVGWTPLGSVTNGGGFALFQEGQTFLNSLEQTFVIPGGAQSLSFDYVFTSTPGGPNISPIPDAFSAYLLDPVTFNPILSTPGFPDYFYHDSSGVTDYDPSIVMLSGNSVILNLTSVPGNANALLAFDFISSDNGLISQTTVDNVQLTVIPEPLTASAVCMALAGLGAYLRRRTA
jgi:hypothetical protein